MSSRLISDLIKPLQIKYYDFEREMRQHQIEFIVTCTYRSNQEQDALYACGRTKPGRIVTNCQGGYSMHNKTDANGNPAAQAFDICILENGKPDWDVGNPSWTIAGQIGVNLGLDWAGNWKSFKEFPHFQLRS